MFQQAKAVLKRIDIADRTWSAFRARKVERDYQRCREHYWEQGARGLPIGPEEVISAIRKRLVSRRYQPQLKTIGQVHTLAFVPSIGWHDSLLPDLEELGPVTRFDYVANGTAPQDIRRSSREALGRRAEMNSQFVNTACRVNAEKPIDWIFVYANGFEIVPEALRELRERIGVPTVNMCLDDKQSWVGPDLGTHRAGQIDIAREFDISWTSARIAVSWYLAEGALPLYQPEGFDATLFRPMPLPRDVDVSFVGAAYGFRRSLIKWLRSRGVRVQTFGAGWETKALTAHEMVEVFNRSKVILGLGGILQSEYLTNVKGRDFEAPGTGGGTYLTTYNPDLASHLSPSTEIACYRTRDEMLEMIRALLASEDEARRCSLAARLRCLREHRWFHRYSYFLKALGILDFDPPKEERA